ncbi:MAG: DNA polymerase Y family protein [Planctomycetota bacterium]
MSPMPDPPLSDPRALVLHVDIDAFFASVEQLRNPGLRGRPVAVGSGVIASCSYEARALGLHNGMPLARAERICPRLAIVRGHAAIYRSYAAHVFDRCGAWSPVVESHLDDAYCDLTGTSRLYPDPTEVGRRLRGTVHRDLGLRVTVGLGRNRMFARLIGARAKPDGLRHLTADEEEALLLPLPVGDLPGIGRKRAEVLERLNLTTVGALRELSRRALVSLFGLDGATIHERARGEDHRAIAPREVPRTIRRSTSFEEDVDDPRRIDGMLEYLTQRAGRHLRQRGLEAGGVHVSIGYADRRRDGRSRRLPAPTALDPELVSTAVSLRRSLTDRRVALRSVGVTLDRITRASLAIQPGLFGEEEPAAGDREAREELLDRSPPVDRERWTRLLGSLDAIRDRHGHAAVLSGGALRWLASDRPDRLQKDRHGLVLRCSSLTR